MRSSLLENVLSRAQFYQWFQRLIGGTRARAWTIDRYVHVSPGDCVLDLGCGPGDLLRLLKMPSPARYLGIDMSRNYLDRARQYESDAVSFLLADCTSFSPLIGERKFEWILCMGLLHHLDEVGCDALLSEAASALAPGGRVVCLEPTLFPHHSWLTQFVMRQDRGKFVRSADDWRRLYERRFNEVQINLLKGAFRIPYEKTVAVLKAPHV